MKFFDENFESFLKETLYIVRSNDLRDEILLHYDEKRDEFYFAANCSDMFWWGTADLEEVLTMEDVALLSKCIKDIKDKNDGRIFAASTWGGVLYAAKKRKLRPQGAVYRSLFNGDEDSKCMIKLFDECGPYRPKDFENPIDSLQYGGKV